MYGSTSTLEYYSHPEGGASKLNWSPNAVQQPGVLSVHSMDDTCVCVCGIGVMLHPYPPNKSLQTRMVGVYVCH